MQLSKEQYDSIMLEYSQTRDRHRHELEQRRRVVYARIPEYRALEAAVPDLVRSGVEEQLRRKTAQDAGDGDTAVRQKIRGITARKEQLLLSAGFPKDYLQPQYDCPDCKDTGYIGSRKCHCLKAREISVLYDQSHLRELIRRENFSTLSEEWYQGEDLARFRGAVQASRRFTNNFGQDYENLYFYGTVGTGKSFLSICIADQILTRGYSVLYFSAASLFDRISAGLFGSRDREDYRSFTRDLYGCDLLIIDDLGTEFTNSFVSSQLFACLNERHLNRKSTIISTNLSLEELRDRYSDRIFSRITCNYTVCKLTGPDIRILRKLNRKESHGTNQKK